MQEIERRNPLLARVANGREAYYQPTPKINLNPAAQNLLGNFFGRNAAANNAWQYQNPQYQNVPLSSYGNQAMIPPEARQDALPYLLPIGAATAAVGSYALNQLGQNAAMRSGMGMLPSAVIAPAVGMAATKLPAPIFNAVNAVANSPVSKWGAKVIDWIF